VGGSLRAAQAAQMGQLTRGGLPHRIHRHPRRHPPQGAQVSNTSWMLCQLSTDWAEGGGGCVTSCVNEAHLVLWKDFEFNANRYY